MTMQSKHLQAISIAFLMLFFSTTLVSAASIQPVTQDNLNAALDTFIVEVKLDTEGSEVNAVEGVIEITSAQPFEILDIILGGSDLTLWPTKPSLSNKNNVSIITYTGGMPGGFKKSDALIMKIALVSQQAGQLQITPKSTKVYLNDGQGTEANINARSLSLNILQPGIKTENELEGIIAADNEPPAEFKINLGHDESVYDGKYFISFQATDNGSGLSHYEVKEGDRNTLRSGTTYILQDQSLNSDISVTAYDKAGNSRVMVWQSTAADLWSKILGRLAVALSAVGLLAIVWFGWKALKFVVSNLWGKYKNR